MSAEGIVTVFSETTATTRVLWCSTVRVRWPNQKAKRRMDRALHKCHWSLAASVGSSKHSHLKPDCDLRHVTPTWLWSRETKEKAKRKMRRAKVRKARIPRQTEMNGLGQRQRGQLRKKESSKRWRAGRERIYRGDRNRMSAAEAESKNLVSWKSAAGLWGDN